MTGGAATGVPILVYHRVTDSPHPDLRYYAVRPATFRRQMRALRLARWRTIGIGELLASRAAGREPPPRSVVVTFDDAYAELETAALPALRANRQTATIFACSELLGASAERLRGGGDPVQIHEDATLMDAAALRRARADGFEVGSHTATHPRLTTLDDARLSRELVDSRAALEEAVGAEIPHLAYPFGDYDERVVEAAAAAGYAGAVTTDDGAAADQPPLQLPRVYVSWGEGAARVAVRVSRRARGR